MPVPPKLEEFWTPEPVIGWRYWWRDRLPRKKYEYEIEERVGDTLYSLCRGDWTYSYAGYKVAWTDPDKDGWYRAVCSPTPMCPPQPKHDPPVERAVFSSSGYHACGFWAIKSGHRIDRSLTHKFTPYSPRNLYVGLVELAGTIIEHRDGYRAELARPLYDTLLLATTENVMKVRDFKLDAQRRADYLPPVAG